jgi:lipoic acid synthetase
MNRKKIEKPRWIKFNIPGGHNYTRVKKALQDNDCHTICMEAKCPNIGECFNKGTATFLIMGDTCTRNCRYCSVAQGIPGAVDTNEPEKIARAVSALDLKYAVITSVTRDDLPDRGVSFFVETVKRIRESSPLCIIELLVPDFRGCMEEAVEALIDVHPHVINHNIEVVRPLYAELRPMGDYDLSLHLLKKSAQHGSTTKSGLMIGFGETLDDIEETMRDLRANHCEILTVGQYLQSKKEGYPVKKYYHPEEFEKIKEIALSLGFSSAASAPNVRSSYHAEEIAGDADRNNVC